MGNKADYFTVAVRTGGPGMKGVSLILMERTMPGTLLKCPIPGLTVVVPQACECDAWTPRA